MNDNMNVEVELPDIGVPEWMNAATPEELSASAEAAEHAMQTSFEEQEREAQARELEERKQRETMQRGYEALSVGWGNPHEGAEVKARRRKNAVDAFGEEYVAMYEQAPEPEQKRAVADRFLTDYYTEAGDEVFSPELRFAEAYGIDPNSDIKEHIYQRFIGASQARHEFDTRIENMREEEMQWIGRYLAGNEEMTAEKGELIVGLFGQEMVERIAKVRDASQLIEEFVKHGEGESKTAGVLLWEEAVYDAVVNPETGEMDNMSRALMTLALRGIAEDVQAEGRETNALQAGKDSLDMAVKRLLWNISNEDSAEYEAARSNLAIYERLATDEGYAASRMTQEQYDALRAKGGRDAAIRLMHAQLYDPEELRRIREELLPAARIDMKKRTSRKVVRGMLQDYVAQADASPEGTSWYKQALKGVGEISGITAPYLIPFAGVYAGTISSIMSASDSKLNANLAAGLSEQAALNSARQDTLIAAAVELMPWSRVGGRGFNATIGRALTSAGYKPGTFAAKIADFASKGTGHAFATEVIGGVVDEGILEPLGQGLLTMSTDAAMDALGVEKAESRTFGEAFAELREVWTNPSQLAALVLFTGALTSARLPQMHEQSKEFAQFLRDNAASAGTWEALGLSDSDVRKIEASDNPLLTGRALFKRALEKDPDGVRQRMRDQGLRLQEEGFTLRLTGTTGELEANAEAAWAESYREMVELGYMPHVERIADQNGQSMYRITERDKLTKEVKSEQEMTGAQADVYLQLKMNQADNIMLERHRKTVYKHMSQYVYQLAGAAMGRELEQKGASEGLTTSDLNELGEGIGEKVQAEGGLSYATMLLAAERLGGRWKARAQGLLQRIKEAGMTVANTQGSAAFREHSGINVQRNGRSVIGSLVLHSKGNATPLEYMEESVESFIDMWVQVRAAETGKSEQESWAEFADIVRQAREELIKLEPSLEIQELPENPSRLGIIETMSDMGRARFINSPLLPAWMAQVQDMVSAAVEEAAMATRIHEAAKKAEKEGLPAWQQMEEIFKGFDVPMGNIYSAARIDAQIIEQVRLARARIGGRQVATTAAEVQDKQAEDVARDEQLEREEAAYAAACPEPPKAEGKSPEEQKADMLATMPETKAPKSMRGVFRNDSCIHNTAADCYTGMVRVKDLRDSKEIQQVKAGVKGKHGVTNPLTGDYDDSAPPIAVWRRPDGALEVISGRHRYALALENGKEYIRCDVYNETAEHNAKWARLYDFENNMRDDQADELTAAIYTRETGYDDATMRRKGLMRNRSKSKRGILIGREARQELWDRFVNGAVNAMDAETICTMTQNVRDKSRVEEIQRRCCMLLEQGKSWDYISAMVQLMANKESVFMRQGLLDLGADFEADMERAAAYVEKCVQKLTEAIGIIKSGRRLSGEKKKLAERLGQNATSAEASEAKLNDLITMREKFRNIGAYPDLVAAASMWDGKTELDPIAMAFSDAHSELEQAAAEAGMTREEWEEAQAEKAAKQAAEEGTGSLFGSFSLRETKSVRDCVDELAAGNKSGTLRNTAWGHDILVPMGVGGSGGYGVKHMHGQRMKQGFNPEEAAFLLVCALKAAEVGQPTPGVRNKVYFDKFGVRAIVAQDHGTGKSFVTGYILDTREKVKADETEDALRAQQFYALDDLRRNQEVGAALSRSVDKLEAIIKQNPRRWEEIVSFEVEKLRIKHNTKAKGTFMKAPNGQPTNLTEQQWLTAQTEAFKAWFGDSVVLDENGEPKPVHHGTARADRVGTVFRPDRATSGPMAFFTDNRDIAGNYARDKQDTSLAYEDEDYSDYHQQFRVKLPNGLDIPLKSYWGFMPFNERHRLAKLAGHIREYWEGDGHFIIDEENNSGSGGFDMHLREARGNAFAALVEEWLNSGNLFNEESRFLEVLELLNLPIKPYYRDPYYREEKVYDVFMRIEKPFRTNRLTKKIVASLRAASKKAKTKESQYADSWDKNSMSPEEWMGHLEDDYANGTDFSWTSIPDWVTAWMKKKGYDGIVDRGGKHHDIGHTVYIPFESTQVKSAVDNRGTFDPQEPDITFSIREAKEQGIMQNGALEASNGVLIDMSSTSFTIRARHASPHSGIRKFLMQFIGTGEGAQMEGWGLYFSTSREAHEWYVEQFSDFEASLTEKARRLPNYKQGLLVSYTYAASYKSWEEFKNEKMVSWQEFADNAKAKGNEADANYAEKILKFLKNIKNINDYVSIRNRPASEYEVLLNINERGDELLRWEEAPPVWLSEALGMGAGWLSGKELYEALADDLGGSPKRASEKLLNLGIKGVEYRDGGSRDSNEKVTYNYVIFDEADVEVVRVKDAETGYEWQDYTDSSYSLRSMTESARVVLRRREDDVEGEELIKRWDDLLARFETASTDKHDGAAQLGTLVSLLEATRSVLPPDYAKLGRLTALMKWASVYAHMVSTGEVKRDGVLKGEIFEKFVAAMKREYEGGLLKGLSEEEAREAVQSIGERRLEDALIKVANECRARLDVFVKARARERIELMAERAYPKKERGQKSPRGKMEAIYYRAMSTMLEWMDAPAEKVVARVNELRGRLDALDAAGVDAEDKGATREELEEELRIVQLYGCWADMSAAQAKQAAEDFVTFVLTQRHAWDARLEMERRRRDYQRLRMRFTQPYNSNTRSDQKRKDSNWKVHKFSIKSLLVNTMSYSQLMLAGRKVFGEQFVRLRLQEIADANAALRNARRDRDNFFARAVMAATGLSGEGELSRWLNKFAKVEKKTGIFKREITHHTLEMERREAEEWCAMTAEERAERRAELEKEAAATGLAPSNVPSEADIDLLRKELAALDERESTAQKVKVRVPRYGQKIELEASRDAVANAILLLEQEDYQHLIEYEGFVPRDKDGKVIDRELFPDEPLDVEQTLKPLYDFIGKEGRAFAYALRRYVGQNGKQMQAVYEAQMGIPLAMKPNYWRGNFNINTIKEKDTLSESNGAVGGGGYGFLIDRVRHYNRLEWSNTATMVFGATVEMQNNYTYTSGITREWRALLSETGFQKRMEVEMGRNYMTALKAWLEVIDKSKGGFAAFADIATWTQRMSRGLAYAALAGNGFVLLKQSSAILHGLMGGEVPRAVVERGDGVRELTWRKIGAAEYAEAMARTKMGFSAISMKELADCEWFQARTDAEYKNVASRMSKLEGQKQHAYATKVAEKSMDAIGWVDRAVNLLGMQALADAVYRDMARLNKESELGLTEEQMKGEALAAVGRALTLAAQPNEASEKSLFAAQGGLISNMLFQFKSETVNKLGLLIARCYAGDWVAGFRDYMTFGAMNTLIAAALAWLRYGDEPEEDEEWKYFTKYGLNILTGDLAAMPLVGEMVQSATSAVTGEYVYQRGFIANYIDPRGIWRSAERLATGEKGNEELDWHGYVKEANALARRLGVLCAFLGEGATWAELMLSAASASNIIRTGADAYEGVTREEDE